MAIPYHEALWQELLAATWSVTPAGGKVQILAKEEIGSAIGRSPDFADAAAMCYADGRPVPTVTFSMARL